MDELSFELANAEKLMRTAFAIVRERRGGDGRVETLTAEKLCNAALLNDVATFGKFLMNMAGDDESDVSVYDTDAYGDSCLHLASREACIEALDLLLGHLQKTEEHQARVAFMNSGNALGSTPLHLAAERGHVSVCMKLLDAGADPRATDLNDLTPLHVCCCSSVREPETGGNGDGVATSVSPSPLAVVRLLYPLTMEHTNNRSRKSPLHCAAGQGRLDIVKELVRLGNGNEDVNYQEPEFLATPLMLAVCSNSVDVVEFLVHQGATLSPKNIHGDTVLQVAKNFGNSIIIRILEAFCADEENDYDDLDIMKPSDVSHQLPSSDYAQQQQLSRLQTTEPVSSPWLPLVDLFVERGKQRV